MFFFTIQALPRVKVHISTWHFFVYISFPIMCCGLTQYL